MGNLGWGGAGICCINSSPLIAYNSITDNINKKLGAGVYCYNSSPSIECNVISRNVGILEQAKGAGIYCFYNSSARILGNRITDNSLSELHSDGAGIHCYKSSPVISNNVISGNVTTGTSCRGGGICCFMEAYPKISNNIITRNSCTWAGGGIYFWNLETFSPVITGNTIYGNSAKDGGGIYCGRSDLHISNTIIWNNSATWGSEICIGNTYYPSVLTLRYCDVKGGKSEVHIDSGSTLHWGEGMINADPAFADPAADDFHLTYPSPCRDAGDQYSVGDPFDYQGDPRVAHENTDMGADEFYTHLYYTGDATPGGSIKGKLVGIPETGPVGLFIGSGILEVPLQHQWGDFWLKKPWLVVPLIPIPSNGILALPATIPNDPSAPYNVPMQGLIGFNPDSLTNLCVLEVR